MTIVSRERQNLYYLVYRLAAWTWRVVFCPLCGWVWRHIYKFGHWFILVPSRLARTLQKNAVRFAAVPVVTVIANLALASYARTELKDWWTTWVPPGAIQFMRDYKLSIIICAFIWNAIIPVLIAATKSSEEADIPVPRMDMWLLLKGIRSVVGEKTTRFLTTVGKAGGGTSKRLRARDIFLRITQPQEQIKKLVEATYQMFQAADQATEIKVSLVAVENGKIVGKKFVHFFPGNRRPNLSVNELNHPSTTASRAIADGKLHLVQDTTDDLSKPVADREYMPYHELRASRGFDTAQAGNTDDELGGRKRKRIGKEHPRSIIAYPVETDGNIIYVLTVIAEKGGYFRRNRIDVYKYVLNEISLRIGLEHSLKTLRSRIEKAEGD